MDRFDAVVIGSGPNGLVAASNLATHGWSTVVLEAADEPGGAVRSGELIENGFLHDHCSAFYPLTAVSPAFAELGLERHGLRWLHAPLVVAHPALDGSCAVLSRDLEETAASLDALHAGDGEAWRELHGRWSELQPALLDTLLGPFPPVRAGAALVRRERPRDLVRLARQALLPVRRMGEEAFEGEGARRLLAGLALHADVMPETTLGGFLGWMLMGVGQDAGFPVPEGGASAITAALVDHLQSLGGQVVCDAPVTAIRVEDGRAVGVELADGTAVAAGRAVLADVSAPALYRRLIEARHLPGSVLDDIDRFHWDEATVKIDWTLDEPIPWSSAAARRSGTVHLAEHVDELTVTASELARGLVPAAPFLIVGQQSMTDPTRQPVGRETAWAYTHVPRRIRGDAGAEIGGGWSVSDTATFVRRIEARIEAHAPGFRDLVRGRHVLTPPRFEERNANLDRGAINGGTAQLHQQAIFRPTPGTGRPSTPIRGLYLASSSAHPGGGVHGAPGRNAARAALAADRRRRLSFGFSPKSRR